MAPPASPLLDSRALLGPLLDSVAVGDPAALAELYARTSAKLYGICLRVLADEPEAQDVLQEVYLTVWHRAEHFDPARGSPIAWLSVIARNRAIDRVRRRPVPSEPMEAAAGIPDASPSAFEAASAGQERSRLHDCMDELEDRPRNMIRAAFMDGRTYPDLARTAAVPLPTMKSWIRRGLLQLRACLEGAA